MSMRLPNGLRPGDARFLAIYVGAGVGMFGFLGLAWALPRLLPFIIAGALLYAYLLARFVSGIPRN